ncbi:MAG: hypothetical protein E6H44_09035 [Betaproteobacteria bacterium]|nr:MAG: hypothetical protein E6H44_09035 [Betaproteobacteria bacterium]
MESEREQADHRFDPRVDEQRIDEALGEASRSCGADRHAAHEHGKDERLRVRRMAEKQLQVLRPDRLVDQPGKPGDDEQAVEGAARHGQRC